MFSVKPKLITLILTGFSLLAHGQPFELTSDNLLPAYSGPIRWADFDSDNDLDIIYCGFDYDGNSFFTKVYRNDNGSFMLQATDLPDIRNGAFALGDYDKDGDLDVLLSGLSNSGNISVLYQNNGGFSFSLVASFPGLINTAVSWFDIDNDNDLDFLLAGVDDNTGGPDPFVKKMMVYENESGNFTPITGTNLPPCQQCSMDWADSNGDGKIDLIITGFYEDDKGHTDLYLNNGNKTFTQDQNSIFTDVANGDVKWGDFDNDGDMDVLLSGGSNDGSFITSVYRNIEGAFSEEKNIQLKGVGESWFDSSRWVDFDNDGQLDILVSGRGGSVLVVELYFKLYKNNGDGTFTEVSVANFSGLADSSVDFGDFDNDGDVDFCFLGMGATGATTGIYKNKLNNAPYIANSKPSTPSVGNLSELFFRKQVRLTCTNGADVQTPPAGLTYNFYVKAGSSNVVAPTSDFTTGYLLSTNPSNGHSKYSVLNDIPEGDYSWAVQTIDGGKAGSSFSAEKNFYQINGPEATKIEIIDPSNIKLSWLDNSSVETSYQLTRSANSATDFSALATLPSNTTSYIDNYNFLTDTYYYYRIAAANSIKSSAYDSLVVLVPTAPANLLGRSVNASKISLTWDDLSQYENGYEVQRKLSTESTFQPIDTLAANVESFEDTGLNEGISYDYRVRALVSQGGSAFSGISSVRTNFKPLGANFGKQTAEDTLMNFTSKDFMDAFSDPDANDELAEILIGSLPQKGTLKLSATAVNVGQIIVFNDLNNLQYIPAPNANGVCVFDFYNNDGKDNSAASYTATLTVTPVNDVPAFSVPSTIEVDENFTTPVKIVPSPAPVPQDELSQVVTYSIQPSTSAIVTVQLNPDTGEINFTSILNEFGEVDFVLTANDGQSLNNTFSDTIKLAIKAAPVTGISKSKSQAIKVFPNPFISSVSVILEESLGGHYIVSLYDQLGQEVSHQKIMSEDSTVTFKDINGGLYVLSIFGDDGDLLFRDRIFKK